MNKLILNNEYEIKLTKANTPALVNLSHKQREEFKNLNAKSKLNRLKFLKNQEKIQEECIDIVRQSRYLKLLKDNSGMHIRLEQDLEEDEVKLEYLIINYLLGAYSLYINEEVNTGMSGDINRIIISKGKNTIE